ncbi:DUF6119 family protein [Olleya sp. HaHaR_3_96]|uniref:DUF6119 family protein n=1 Tax=Olleya sp. HaHaR_3_96 TaxID=2745560 RepID=UPI001C4F162D|nr:DUF6119 family protein [Olleya sp. HaHaR_3_96]QXP59718.1 TIGR04141 family sporadically distributed protein [Olleya sp. HaHaR_3_96]
MEDIRLRANGQYEIKIFQIDTTHRDLIGKTKHQIVNTLVKHHKTRIEETEVVNDELVPNVIDGVHYYTYVYNEKEKKAHWDNFLPPSLLEGLDFTVVRLSFVLFACVEDKIFAVIGGGGTMVIKSFQNYRFGLEFYEYLTTLDEEIISLTTRGISGTLTQSNRIFKEGQRLSDVLNFVNIPSSINLILNDEIKDTYFDFIDFGNKNVQLEITSYFHIKHSISFKELHQLFLRINEIMTTQKRRALTSFEEIKERGLTDDEFVKILMIELREDMLNRFSVARGTSPRKSDIDFVHPSKLKQFYECDRFEIKKKGQRKDFTIVNDRNKIYKAGLEFVFNQLDLNATQQDFNKIMWRLRVDGFKGNSKKRYVWANFWHYVTCELQYENRPIFHIDSKWYSVKDDFRDSMNRLCSQMINRHHSKLDILFYPWIGGSEDSYNSKYRDENGYLVFDKALGQNIELCDIMFENDDTIYFIHIKTGFDAKIRDLSNQVVISANRFMISRNSGDNSFVNDVVDSYNSRADNNGYEITDKDAFLQKFATGGKEIVFVMAFKSDTQRVPVIRNNLDKLESNIAKFSLIQCVREMSTFNYPIEIIEIKNS